MSLGLPQSKLWARDLESGTEPSTRAPSPSPLSAPPLLHHDLFGHHDLPDSDSTDHLDTLLHPSYHHDPPHHPEKTTIITTAFPHTHGRHPVQSQRQLFLLACTSALTVGIGLGGAVGIWKSIHVSAERATHHDAEHLCNWPAGFLMGFVLAPILETSARAFFAKATGVLTVPVPPPARGGFFSARTVSHRFMTHLLTVSAALIGLGAVKGVQMQYGPTRGVLGMEFPTFVVGFTMYGLVRLVLEVVCWDSVLEVERRGEGASWGRWVAGVGREIGALYTGRTVLTVLLRDALTFAIFPYLGSRWIGFWKAAVDPREEWTWVPHALEIGFFFSLFSTFKELTAVLAVLLFGGK